MSESEAKELKRQIYDECQIEEVLEKLGMHNIRSHDLGSYWTCGMPDGDNPSSTTIYNEEKIGVKAYTREEKITDIISLVQYIEKTDFRGALNWLYDKLHIPKKRYYGSLGNHAQIQSPAKEYISRLQRNNNLENVDNVMIPRIYDEITLFAYYQIANTDFEKDNITVDTQYDFELGIDVFSHRATIPIRDEIGNLIGIKGRVIFDIVDEYTPKYIYLMQCPKSFCLYGLDKTYSYIKQENELIICEAEKGVMQLYSYGYKNAVAIGGHDISDTQLEKIIKLDVNKVIIAFDQDIDEKKLYVQYQKLCDFTDITCIIDKHHILNEKESPMDNPTKWETLYKECQAVPREFPEFEIDEV